MLHSFVLLTNLAEDALDLLEGVARDHLLDALPQLSHSLLILSVPFFAHPPQLIFQGSRALSREIDVFRKLPQLQVILVVVMHFPESCLAVKLVLGSLALDLELVDFLVELGKAFDDPNYLVTTILQLGLSVRHLAIPVLPELLLLL